LGIGAKTDAYSSPEKLIDSGIKYDIVFLDVEMGAMTGIEAADALHEINRNTLIFFATNYEGYMDEALNKHAFRFWVKPLNRQRLLYGLESAVRELSDANTELLITVGRKSERIPVKDIIYVYAKNKNTCIVTRGGEVDVREPFKNITERLNPKNFCASHASYCVNLEYVVKYTNDEVICRCGDNIYTAYMSKRKYSAFAARFMKWAGEHI
jgi:DNA-binding LytR/AlgR family response regulator